MAQRGRPPGSVNRTTAQWSAYIKTAYGSPLDEPARMSGMSIPDLARELGCTRSEAAEFQLQCMEFVLSYTHSEMPRAVMVDATVAGDTGPLASFFTPALVAAVGAAAAAKEALSEPDDKTEGEPPSAA